MIADILTKHFGGPDFKRMSKRLRNIIEQDPTLSNNIYKHLYLNSNDQVYVSEDADAVKILSTIIAYLRIDQLST